VDELNDRTGYLGANPQAMTPNINKLVNSGIAFIHAYTPAPSCGLSRTTLLYGLAPHKTGAYGNSTFYTPKNIRTYSRVDGIPDSFKDQKKLPTTIRANVYDTAGSGKISHFSTREPNPEIEEDLEVYFSPRKQQQSDPKIKSTYTNIFRKVIRSLIWSISEFRYYESVY
jgi:arylsulfatase A-like enzyme